MIATLALNNLDPVIPVPSSIVFKHTAGSQQMVYKHYPSLGEAMADLSIISPICFWYDADGILTNGVFSINTITT